MRIKTTPPPEAARDLEEIRLLTWMMREHQEQVTRLGQRRREKVLALRERTPDRVAVTYRALAEAMDVSEQAVHKILVAGKEAAANVDSP